ncbi:DNA-binding SARP family transcriptional activator [Catenulispora sp. EB89]|uniref:AfsR/SARP family transcriptional regulator n=1 Tax=Catenulispora sp. EB89 TaxID=3156257 RepID=UPI0035111803
MVLASLLLDLGDAVPVADLVGALWGPEPPRNALGTVRTYISRLRKVIVAATDSDPIRTVGDTYLVDASACSTDVQDVHRTMRRVRQARAAGEPAEAEDLCRRALALWHGTPLLGLPGSVFAAQRARLAELRVALASEHSDALLALGRHAEAVLELKPLVAEFPLHEALRGSFMLALHGSGHSAEALAGFEDLLQRLDDGLGLVPGPEIQAIHDRIREQTVSRAHGDVLAATAATAATAGSTSAAHGPDVPAQLPAALPDFTGRVSQAAELRAALLADSGAALPVAALAGMGGVGKTTLALYVAHSVSDRFSDGRLYADLRGADGVPADPQAVLRGFLTALGVASEDVPDGLPERSALFRTLTTDRRILVLLDNAADAAQVGPLLPGSSTCAALITCRARLVGLPAVHTVDLKVMPPAEAGQLLRRIVGAARADAEPEALAQLADACGHLPLALRIVGTRLATRMVWTLADMVARLGDERRALAALRTGDLSVPACFAIGYQQLGTETARAFRLLAALDLPELSAEFAAAALGLAELPAEDVLEALVDAALLETPRPGRYRYHDLVRVYARSVAAGDPDGVSAALTGVLDHGYASGHVQRRLGDPDSKFLDAFPAPRAAGTDFADFGEARRWMAEEVRGLTLLARQAGGGTDDQLRTAVLVMAVLDHGEEAGDLLSLEVDVIGGLRREAAARGDERTGRIAGMLHVHNRYIARDLPEALDASLPLIEQCRAAGEDVLVGWLAHIAGTSAHHLGRRDVAEAMLRLCRDTGIALDDTSLVSTATKWLIFTTAMSPGGEITAETLRLAQSAFDLDQRAGNRLNLMGAWHMLARVHDALADVAEADHAYRRTIELTVEFGHREREVVARRELAAQLHRLERREEAVEQIQRALAVAEDAHLASEESRLREMLDEVLAAQIAAD